MAGASQTERELIEAVARGEKAAMRKLYELHHDPLFAFLKRKCGDDFLAADVLHDTMMEVWRSSARYSGKSSPKTWIFAIAKNKLYDQFRKGSRLSVMEEPPEVIDDAPDPATVIQNAQNAARVRACLDGLSDNHKTAIELAFFHELKYEEIAEVEQTPVSTIKTRIFHAKKLLMRCLGHRD